MTHAYENRYGTYRLVFNEETHKTGVPATLEYISIDRDLNVHLSYHAFFTISWVVQIWT